MALYLRKWAQEHHVHGIRDGGLPSVALNHLVVHYLQRARPRVLPRLPTDFIRLEADLPHLQWKSKNTRSLAQLYRLMVSYLTTFDFTTRAISITVYKRMRANELMDLKRHPWNTAWRFYMQYHKRTWRHLPSANSPTRRSLMHSGRRRGS